MQLRRVELLAPAKNREIGIAAVNCGADSLYIAGPAFGARKGASNSFAEIEKLAKYAHRYGVALYLTLNTIIYEEELEEAIEIANRAYEAGCDALIIQDLGLLKAELPPLPLFASTQTNIRSVEQAKLLEALGFSRLILARELSLSQIREIGESCTVELESFVHGALCLSYSGECYLSSRLTGRSANRGECAQPCRNSYNLLDSNGKKLISNRALLSLKDLKLDSHLPSLIESGVSSFKIEGRLKELPYVTNVVKHYREKIDSILNSQKSSYGSIEKGVKTDLDATFNRGYTSLYIEGKRGEWSGGHYSRPIGESIGEVTAIEYSRGGEPIFSFNSAKKINNGDGLSVVNSRGESYGFRASVVEGETILTNREGGSLPLNMVGGALYRNFNREFERELLSNRCERYIEVQLFFSAERESLTLIGKSEDGREFAITKRESFEKATAERAKERTIAQLEKRTELYKFRVVSYSVEEQLFYPASFLNGLRRELASLFLNSKIELQLPPRREIKRGKNEAIMGRKISYKSNIANSLAKELYLELGAEQLEAAFELSPPKEAELMRSKYCIKEQLGRCPLNSREKPNKRWSEPLYLENSGKRFRVEFDCKRCEMIIFG